MAESFSTTRRNLLIGGVSLTIAAELAVIERLSREDGEDGLFMSLMAYRSGATAFEAIDEADWALHGGEDAVISKTFGPHLAVLKGWDKPADNRETALEALRFALEENTTFEGPKTVNAMLISVIGYLEKTSV